MSKSTAEIRQMFLDFFHSKGHQVVASSSLVPHNDPTLLFTNAGMNQFKNVFLGLEQIDSVRATSSQRCIRAGGKHNDLENVGYTARHHTFFEMLGNFSFGDYFKSEAIHFAWELLTSEQYFHLPKDKLWITVYKTDDKTYRIWADEVGIPAERIIRIGDNKGGAFASDNFWQMGDTGPCGPCTEIFYDHGDHLWGDPPGSPEEEGDRYIEIWNIVFMQFNRQLDGTMLALPQPSVDTGMGLERIAAVLQQVNSNYEIDLFRDLIKAIAEITAVSDLSNQSLRVIADHIRSCAFLIADGVMPSNENRGYVLRRIIRRAIRHGHMLGIKSVFFYKLVAPLISVMGSAAEALKQQQSLIEQWLKTEEEQFARTLERGLALLDEELSKITGDTLAGETAFRLYDTYGFPLDLTADVCRERHLKVDEAGFERAMAAQRLRARDSNVFATDYNNLIKVEGKSEFSGYEHQHLQQQALIIALIHNGKAVDEIHFSDKASPDEEILVILDKTPFYAESGGQVGDSGKLVNDSAHFTVRDTQKHGATIAHVGQLTTGCLRIGESINAAVDAERRHRIRLNHSATHLLHAALRQTLGQHVAQKGSLVNDHYLRFDFSHSQAMTKAQIQQVELQVNAEIRANLPIETKIMALEEAKKTGAMAFFGEKYSDKVRVLTMGTFSIELCGGTHTNRTGDIGLFRITAESATAAGIRRIEAVTGEAAMTLLHQESHLLHKISYQLKGDSSNLLDKISKIQEHNKNLEQELQQLKAQQAKQKSISLSDSAQQIKGGKLLVKQVDNITPEMLKTLIDSLKQELKSAIIVLATKQDNKVNVIVGVTKNLTDKIKAGELVADLAKQLGGKGGGRAEMAMGGGTNVATLPAALASVRAWVDARL